MQPSKPKVFFIGYNKTGTVALHTLFKDSGYSSVHHSFNNNGRKRFLGQVMLNNYIHNYNLLDTIEEYDVYSELTFASREVYFEGGHLFKLLNQQYPNSYFILQTRNIDDWIKSRFNHKSKHIDFYERAKSSLHLNDVELETYWRKERETFYKNVKKYFKSSPNFTVFDIDNDNIDVLIKFLKKDYKLDNRYWKKYNVTETKRIS